MVFRDFCNHELAELSAAPNRAQLGSPLAGFSSVRCPPLSFVREHLHRSDQSLGLRGAQGSRVGAPRTCIALEARLLPARLAALLLAKTGRS